LRNPKKSFSFFNSIIHAYFRLFTLPQTKPNKLFNPFTHPPHLKNAAALPCKMQNFFIHLTEGNVAFLQTLVALKRAGCGLALVA